MTEWILSSCVLILVVVLLRQLLKGRLSLRLQYALWALVLIRLLVPFSFGVSRFSVTNAVREVQVRQTQPEITIADPPSKLTEQWQPELAPSFTQSVDEEGNPQYTEDWARWEEDMDAAWEEYKAENTEYVTLPVSDILRMVWIAGMIVAAGCFLAPNLRFWLRLRRSRRVLHYMPLTIYTTEAVETPCLFGLFKPAIYVTPEVAEDEVAMGHVLAHETTHYRHRDHLWSVLRCVCLVLHWYNPLVWLAAALSRRDAELACDEGTLLRIGEGERAAYGRTLISLTCTRRGGLFQTATTMTGSQKSIKERIVLIAKKPKMKLYTLIAVLLIAAIAVGCTYTGSASISDWAEDLTVEDLRDTVKLCDIRTGSIYSLSEEEREELLTILRGIDDDQILKNVSAEAMEPGNYCYDYTLTYSTGNDVQVLSSISFSFLDNGAVGVNCFGDLGYLTGLGSEWKWLDSPELYRFMADCFALPEVSDAENASPAAMHYAHQVIEEHLAALQAQGIDAKLYNVQALHSESTGTAGANTSSVEPPSLAVYRLSYCLDGLEGDYYGSLANFTKYLFIFVADGKSTLVKTADMVSLSEEYLATEEMQEKYNGNTLEAAAIELFNDCMEERNAGGESSVQLSAPASPSDGLYRIAKRGDTASVTLYTTEEGEQSTFVLDYKSDAWKRTNKLTGTQWMVLSEAPEGEWDYWLTYTSADGTASVTFYHGKDGPVKYEDGEHTVWWQVRPNFWNGISDAEKLRTEIYDVLEASWNAATPGEALTAMAEGETLSVTLYTAELGQRNTYPFEASQVTRTEAKLWARYTWQLLLEEPAVDSEFWLTLTAADGAALTFFSREEALVRYQSGDDTLWWRGTGKYDDDYSLAEDMRWTFYDSMEINWRGIPGFSASSPTEAANEFARLWGQCMMDSTPGGICHVLDYELEALQIWQISTDGKALVAAMSYYVLPENFDSSGLWAGNTTEGTGQYEGWLNMGRCFVLERQEDGLWHCISLGTGGGNLESYGYENGYVTAFQGVTKVYRWEGEDPEQAAQALAKAYVDDLMVPDDMRGFIITEYRSLSVHLTPTLELSEETVATFDLSEEEKGENVWLVGFSLEYRFDGQLEDPPLGPGGPHTAELWFDMTHQGSGGIGFLMTREGNTFTLQSRYDKIYS